jgi:hypothetical protein
MSPRSSTPRSRLAGASTLSGLLKLALFAVALFAIWWLAMSSPEQPLEAADGAAGEHAEPTPAPAPPAAAAPSQPKLVPAYAPPAAEQPAAPAAPPPAAEPTAAPAAPAAPAPPEVPVPQRQGPVEELTQRFAGESRGPSSEQDEARVRTAFNDPAVPTTTLHRVECRRTVCRAELRWSPQQDAPYVLGLTKAVGSFSAPLGIEGAGPPDADGQRPLVVYFGLNDEVPRQ